MELPFDARSYTVRAMKEKPMNQRERWETDQIGRAAYFTACRFRGRGRYDIRRAPSQEAAETIGAEMGRAMIYAVTPEGWSIHIRNV